MAKQLHLKRKELDNLIDCTLNEQEYIQLLKDRKII